MRVCVCISRYHKVHAELFNLPSPEVMASEKRFAFQQLHIGYATRDEHTRKCIIFPTGSTNFTYRYRRWKFGPRCLQQPDAKRRTFVNFATKIYERSMLNVYRPFESAFRDARWTIAKSGRVWSLACSSTFQLRDIIFQRRRTIRIFALGEKKKTGMMGELWTNVCTLRNEFGNFVAHTVATIESNGFDEHDV